MTAPRTLTLPLNSEYFDQIASGEKVEEYRLANPFWERRIVGKQFDTVVLMRGYPKGGGVEGVTRLTRQWRGYAVQWISHPHFGDEPVMVFAISVSTPARHSQGSSL